MVFSTSPLSLLLGCCAASTSTSPVALALAPRSAAGNPAALRFCAHPVACAY
jgi:hypothetical protein